MKLTSEQEDAVYNFVSQHGITKQTLHDDLVDHLCCVIESDLKKGKSFEQLLSSAVADLAPGGLIELEQKTIFLLNSKRILIMKKLLYLIGFIGALSFSVGTAFKLLHLPGAGILLLTGCVTLLLIFIPLLGIDRYKVKIAKALSERLKIILGVLSAMVIGASVLFKVLHLQGAELLLIVGTLLFAVGFLPFFFFTMYKKSIA